MVGGALGGWKLALCLAAGICAKAGLRRGRHLKSSERASRLASRPKSASGSPGLARFTQHLSRLRHLHFFPPPSTPHRHHHITAMILRSTIAAALLALQASAFLVPLEVAEEVEAAKAQLEALWTNKAHTVELSCPGCTFPGPVQDGLEYATSDENTIVSAMDSIASAPLHLSDRIHRNSRFSSRIGPAFRSTASLSSPSILR